MPPHSLGSGTISFGLVSLPWLRGIDGAWLASSCVDGPIVCLDNHYTIGGQGDAVLAALADTPDAAARVLKVGLDVVPRCGANDEVLRAHGLDAQALARRAAASARHDQAVGAA